MHHCRGHFLRRWTADLYRIVFDDEFATHEDLMSGKGSKLIGGRYNARGSFPVAYASPSIETAVRESLFYGLRFAGGSDALAESYWDDRVLGTVSADFQYLDLTHRHVAQKLEIRSNWLESEWEADQLADREALTQAIGRAAHVCGIPALLVPSARRIGYKNMVILPDHLGDSAELAVTTLEPVPNNVRRFS